MWREAPQVTLNDPEILVRIERMIANPDVHFADMEIFKSFKDRWDKHNNITKKQEDFLKSLEARYDPQRLAAAKDWISSYDEEKRKAFKLAVQYYSATMYFTDIVNKAKTNPDYIPTYNQFVALTQNKYFLRAQAAFNTPPKYNIGDLVVFRKTHYKSGQENIFLVEEVVDENVFVLAHRRYKLMVLGTPEIETATEGDIKMYREKKGK